MPKHAVPILTAWQPLFDADGWGEALDVMEREAVPEMRSGLIQAAGQEPYDPEEAEWIANAVRRDVELYRPLLGERPGLLALDVGLACQDASSEVARRHVRDYLRRFETLEPAIVLCRQAQDLLAADRESQGAVDPALVDAVIERLDSRWRLWAPCVFRLVVEATKEQMRQLRAKIRRWQRDVALAESDREELGQLLKDLAEVRGMARQARAGAVGRQARRRSPEGGRKPSRSKAGERRERRPRVDDRQLDLF